MTPEMRMATAATCRLQDTRKGRRTLFLQSIVWRVCVCEGGKGMIIKGEKRRAMRVPLPCVECVKNPRPSIRFAPCKRRVRRR